MSKVEPPVVSELVLSVVERVELPVVSEVELFMVSKRSATRTELVEVSNHQTQFMVSKRSASNHLVRQSAISSHKPRATSIEYAV